MIHRRPTDPSPQLQHLENRRLLASFATLSAGTLTLTGTKRSESFALLERSGKLRVLRDGVEVRFNVSSVTKVIASLNAGNDSFVMNSALSIPATVFGGSGNDRITTGRGNDRIEGGDGDDVLHCDLGDDRVYGDGGFDTLSYAHDRIGISVKSVVTTTGLDSTEDTTVSVAGDMYRSGERDRHADVERIEGTDADDAMEIRVNDPGFRLQNVERRFELDGGSGNDSMSHYTFYTSATQLIGGNGDDRFSDDSFGTVQAAIVAGAGIDSARFKEAPPSIFTLPQGLENFQCDDANKLGLVQTITGNELDNVIKITTASSTSFRNIDGLSGNDQITVLASSPPNETATRAIFGGDGDDRIEYHFGTGDAQLTYSMLFGGSGNDTLIGGATNDTIRGDAGDDLIYGGNGADRLYGGDGNDTLDGQSGRDLIYGGAGTDRGKKQSTDRAFDSIEVLL